MPEILSGSPNLVTENAFNFYVYVVFFSGLFTFMAFILLFQSWEAISIAMSAKRSDVKKE